MKSAYHVGDKVCKHGKDYTFVGIVIAVFETLDRRRSIRYVVENSDGIMRIFSAVELNRLP